MGAFYEKEVEEKFAAHLANKTDQRLHDNATATLSTVVKAIYAHVILVVENVLKTRAARTLE